MSIGGVQAPTPAQQRFAAAPALVAVFGALSAAATQAGVPAGFCLSRRLFRVRCPGCGVTTSVLALLRGDLRAALAANAAGPVVLTVFMLHAAVALVDPGRPSPERWLHGFLRTGDRVLLLSLLTSWIWHIGTTSQGVSNGASHLSEM